MVLWCVCVCVHMRMHVCIVISVVFDFCDPIGIKSTVFYFLLF